MKVLKIIKNAFYHVDSDIIFKEYKSRYVKDLELIEVNKKELNNSFYRAEYVDSRCQKISREEFYLNSWRASSLERRKPIPGFHPGIYKELKKLSHGCDPYVDFLANQKPEGPWLIEIIAPTIRRELLLPPNSQIALHIHVHYLDKFEEIIAALEKNIIRPDLFISITNPDLSLIINHLLKDYSGQVISIEVFPNRGRDIGPFLGSMGREMISNYEYLGHIHTKKSPHTDSKTSSDWSRFLIANLLSLGEINSADQIIQYLVSHSDIGLVFPDDPQILSWGINYSHARGLANQMGIGVLPYHFNFPVGTMFWCRASALAPLMELNLSIEDLPEEPLPIDGTILHAIERLLPFIAEKAGFSYALVNSSLVTR
jgi:hypothetical protein